jgi:hypothetical protein
VRLFPPNQLPRGEGSVFLLEKKAENGIIIAETTA